MPSLMLINPRKRGSGRSAAQKAATRRMLAANKSKRRSNPSPRKAKRSAARRSNPSALHRVRRRRNPISLGGMGGVGGMLMNGLKGAGGAIVVNVVAHYLPPVTNTGKMVYVTRTALALALGTLGRKLLGNSARAMAEGALAVNFHDAINSVAGTMLPGSGLHGNAMAELINANQGALPGAIPSGSAWDSELSHMGEYIDR